MPTIAVEFSSKLVTLDNTETIKTQIWDTAGQETYRSLTMRYPHRHPGTTQLKQLLSQNARSHHRL
jgi:predicted AlkP superfamily phosphohydrolase/phosphomutase